MVRTRSGKSYSVAPTRVYPWWPMVKMAGGAVGAYYAQKAGKYIGNQFAKRTLSSGASAVSTGPALYGGGANKPYSRQYRFKRMSRRRRTRRRKMMKRYKKIINKVSGVANQKLILNGSVDSTTGAAGQDWVATHLFPYNSNITPASRETGVDDIRILRNSMTNTVYTDDVTATTKFMVKYGIIDMTIHNTGDSKLEVDKYHLVYRDNVEYTTLAALLNGSYGRQASLTNVIADKIALTSRGSTIFDLPTTTADSYMKVLSKEKLFLGVGETMNFQHKHKKPFSITLSEIQADNNYYARKGWTHTFLFVFKQVTGGSGVAPRLQLGCTRSYAWYVEGETQPGTATL